MSLRPLLLGGAAPVLVVLLVLLVPVVMLVVLVLVVRLVLWFDDQLVAPRNVPLCADAVSRRQC
jgi:hypothetical protein